MIYQAFIEMALSQACAGIDPLATPISDTGWIGEDFVSTIFQQVGRQCAADERKRSLLRKLKTVTFANGVATLTSDVLTEYKEDSTLYDAADSTKEYSLVREWGDFIQPRAGWMLWQGNYCMNGVIITVVEPSESYIAGSGLSGGRVLGIPCVPVVPAAATDAIDAVEEITDDLLTALATALKGEIVKR